MEGKPGMRAMIRLFASALALAATPAAAQAPGEDSAVRVPACDRDCLIGMVQQHMKALAARDPSQLKLAPDVRFTENNVLIPVGDGLWDTVTAVDATGLEAADPTTGNAASNAEEVSAAPVWPLVHTPLVRITSAVNEHTMIVSMKGASMAISP